MDILVDYKRLFDYRVENLKKLVADVTPEAWLENDVRQTKFDVHKSTESIVYVWSEFSDANYENVRINIPANDADPLATEVWTVAEKIRQCYGPKARITKLMLAKLKGRGEITPHFDKGNLTKIHRCHLPIISSSKCIFYIDNKPYNFKPPMVFEFNNQKLHAVTNKSPLDRVHLICDILD
jgi:hypothetical protein